MSDTSNPGYPKPEISLRRTGGAGPNANWHWEVRSGDKVLKSGSAVGDEARAFATARKAADKLAKG